MTREEAVALVGADPTPEVAREIADILARAIADGTAFGLYRGEVGRMQEAPDRLHSAAWRFLAQAPRPAEYRSWREACEAEYRRCLRDLRETGSCETADPVVAYRLERGYLNGL